MTQATRPTTSVLFARAHSALCAGRWAEARAQLDLLGDRPDNRDFLCDASAYSVPAHLTAPIQDRIDLVNAKAGSL